MKKTVEELAEEYLKRQWVDDPHDHPAVNKCRRNAARADFLAGFRTAIEEARLNMLYALLSDAENALTDYIERLERDPGVSLNYGKSIVSSIKSLKEEELR